MSAPAGPIIGTTPDVESVVRRFEKSERVRVRGDGDGGLDVVEIIERLAHTHQHQIGDLALRLGDAAPIGGSDCAGPFADAVAGRENLPDDFRRREIAHEPLRAGVAKAAGQGAADLA